MIRSFISIPLPPAIRDALEDIQADLDVGRLTAPETFHITLAYLDKQTPQMLERMDEVLQQIDLPAFPVHIKGVGLFGGKAPRALWAGVETDMALSTLRERVRRAVSRSGVDLPRERFRAHVTLARFKGRFMPRDETRVQRFLAHHAASTLPAFTADRFVLYRSTLHHSGAMHDPLVDYPLR